MKVFIYTLRGVLLSLFILGYLFKIKHWPYADLMLTVSLLGGALVYVPLATYRRFKNDKD